jgi:hypothetical protein
MHRSNSDGDEEPTALSEFPLIAAECILESAPYPTHNRGYGRRPHAHYDIEDD